MTPRHRLPRLTYFPDTDTYASVSWAGRTRDGGVRVGDRTQVVSRQRHKGFGLTRCCEKLDFEAIRLIDLDNRAKVSVLKTELLVVFGHRDISPSLLRKIASNIDMTIEEFLRNRRA